MLPDHNTPQLPGELIRDIEMLPVSDFAKSLIKELDAQIDMPVVFWIDYPKNRSDTGRQPGIHNQYCVAVAPQKERSEFERIILHHMLRGVMQTNRFPALNGKPDYIRSIIDTSSFEPARSLCEKINALITTEICRAHFKPYGIETSSKSLEQKIEVIKYQAKRINVMDLSDAETIKFILELGSLSCLSPQYHRIACHLADRSRPRRYSRIIKSKMEQVADIIQTISKTYHPDHAAALTEEAYNRVLAVFSLEDKFEIEYPYIMKKEDVQIDGVKRVYSFVPDDIEEKAFYVGAVKEINTSLVLLQEYLTIIEDGIAEDFHVNLADGDCVQAFADGNRENGYYISVTKPMLLKLREYAQMAVIPQKVYDIGLDDEESFRKRIFKCLIMSVFFHEYGHIHNGDCDNPSRLTKAEKEAEADSFSVDAFQKSCLLQYRFGNQKPEAEMELLWKKLELDQIAFSIAQRFLAELRKTA